MSTLRTNALEGVDAKNSITIVAGAGNITTTNVQEGLLKQWVSYNQTSIVDSFNTTSFTDNGTGDYSITIANNMSSNYAIPMGQQWRRINYEVQDNRTTTLYQIYHTEPSGSLTSLVDVGGPNTAGTLGDLA